MKYLWEKKNWFDFKYDEAALLKPLGELRVLQGKLLGRVASLDLKLETEAQGAVLVEEAVRTAEIEGEKINRDAVRSSVAVRLGLPKGIGRQEKHIDGLVDVLLDAVRFHNRSLTLERLNGWQAALFPTGYSGLRKIKVGRLRGNEPMQVVSGPIGREKVHFEALPRDRLDKEMRLVLKWWNSSQGNIDGILRAAAAHFARRGGDPPELPQHYAVPVDRPADHPPVDVRRVVRDSGVGEERVVPQHRPRRPPGGEPARIDAPGRKPDPLEAAAKRRQVVLPAGQALQVGRLDLHRRPGGLVPAARGPGQPSGRQHQGDQQGGRSADPGPDRGFVPHPDLDARDRGEMAQGAGQEPQLSTEGETVGVGGGDGHPEIRRIQPCRTALVRAHQDLAVHRDGGVHRHRVPDQKVKGVEDRKSNV